MAQAVSRTMAPVDALPPQSATAAKPKKKRSAQIALVMIAQAVEHLGVIVLAVVLSRLLSRKDYGSFRELWAMHRTLQNIIAIGIPVAIQYYLPKLVDGAKHQFMTRCLTVMFAMGTLTAGGLYLSADSIAGSFNNPDLAHLLRIFCLYPLFVLPTQALRAMLIEFQQTVRFAVFTIADQALLIVLGVLAIVWYERLDVMVMVIVGLGSIKLGVALVMLFASLKPLPRGGEAMSYKALLWFSAPLALSMLIETTYTQLDKLITAVFFTADDFARYANGAFHVPVVSAVVISVSMVLLPEYVRRHKDGDLKGIVHLWHRSIRATALAIVPMVTLLVVFGESFVVMMFSKEYADSSLIFQVYILALLFRMTWYHYVLLGMGLNREPVIGIGIALGCNVVLSILFTYEFGVIGPAAASVCSDVVMMGYFLMRIRQTTGVGWREVYPWRTVGSIAGLSLIGAFAVFPLTWLDTVPAGVRLLMGTAMYMPIMLALLRTSGLIHTLNIRTLLNEMKNPVAAEAAERDQS